MFTGLVETRSPVRRSLPRGTGLALWVAVPDGWAPAPPAIGESIDVPALEAAELIANGFARAPEGKSVKAEPEKATARRKPESRGGLTKDSLG